ncbi:MAG: tripartite tricarboxylate transporter TctB family protein [Micrococcaceae bacterium]
MGLFAVVGIFGAWVSWQAFNYGVGSLTNPGVGAWPLIVGIALVLLGVWLLKGARRESATERVSVRDPLILWGLMLVWALMLNVITFIAVSSVILFLIFKVIGRAGWIQSILVPVITSTVIYYVFANLLAVPLP